jgi:hypothetical protein
VDVLLGAVVGDRYRILEKIGAGGMATVYRGEHQLLRKGVAIKILPPEVAAEGDMAARFEHEAVAAARLDHPNCMGISDFGRMPGGQLYLVMELIDGVPLSQLCGMGKRLPWDRAVEIARQILRGMARAHELGILHRDLKPANIMLSQRAAGFEVAKIIDFGIAKMVGDAKVGPRVETRAGTIFGTADFIAPERLLGKGEDDPRSDLYSVGVTLYEMITGARPFWHEEPYTVVKRALSEPPKPPRQVAPDADIPIRLESIVLKALAKDPDDRYASAREFLAALDAEELRTAAHPVVVAATRALELGRVAADQRDRRKRRWVFWAAGGAALVVLVVLGIVFDGDTSQAVLAPPPPPTADAGPPPDFTAELDRLVAQAANADTLDLRQSAADRLVALGHGDKVPLARKKALDLHQLEPCERRLRTVEELEKLGDPVAIASLQAALVRADNDCLRERTRVAVAVLEGRQPPPVAPPPPVDVKPVTKPNTKPKKKPSSRRTTDKKPSRGGHF